jgi:hypothetical protein
LRRLGFVRPNALLRRAPVGFVWPSVVLFMFKHCFHYGFAVGFVCGSWLRLRKLASFAENVRDDCTPRTKPISSAQDRRHNNLLTSHAKNKARRSKPHRAFITVLKDALLCMSPASFASKIRSAKFVPQCQVVAMQSCNILPRNICGRRSRRGSGQLGPTDPGTAFSRFEHIAASINLVLRSARLRASRRTATSGDRASGHPSRRAHAGMRPPQDEAFETAIRHYDLWTGDAAAAARSGKAPASAAWFGATMPRSVIRPVTSRAGVTSNA